MTIATTDEQKAVQQSIAAWARAADPIGTMRAGNGEFWRSFWTGLAGLGVFSVALPVDAGGAGGSVVDLAAMLEQSARELVGGPVLATALAGLIVGREAGTSAAKQWGADLADGNLPCAVVLDGAVAGAATDDGLILTGDCAVALGASPSTAVLMPVKSRGERVWCLVEAGSPGLGVESLDGVDPSCPIAGVHCDGVRVAGDRVFAGVRDESVRDLAAVLATAEAAGVAGRCLQIAVDYAKVREQFGKPIGSFQAVKHICAQMLCRVELIRAVAWDAASAAEEGSELPIAAAVAATVALDAAVETAKDCIQVLGGIGFTWEHDAHFYLRRVTALRQILGGSAKWRARVTDLSRSGQRRTARIDLSGLADERVEIARMVDGIAASEPELRRVALADNGLLAPHWPAPYGRSADAAQQLVIADELARAGVQVPDLVIGAWALPTILEHGTAEQIDRFVRPTLRGELEWCQLFSEPGAGSDLASLRTSASRVDGGWILNGQKVWTSRAHDADWGICLARSDKDAPKHRGITYFLVDMRSAGVRISPLLEIIGEPRFNEVFLDDVFVPDECVVGAVGGGWRLANTTLANERVAIGGGASLDSSLEALLASVPADDAVAADRLGALIADGIAGSLLGLRAAIRQLAGQSPGAESSVRKLVGVRHRQDVAEFALEHAGPAGATESPLTREFLLTRCLSIAGGTTQILLTLAAERILGLPR